VQHGRSGAWNPTSRLFGWLYGAFGTLTDLGVGVALAAVAGLMLLTVRAEHEVPE
jgi:hypothetical protein